MSALTTKAPMTARLRPGAPEDAEACGRICHAAFTAIATEHGFPSDFPSPEAGIGLLTMLLSDPGFYSVVAERDGEILGSNFLDERSPIAGVGPVTVDPAVQNGGLGRLLMQGVMERAHERRFAGIRLLQAAYHNRSLSLYARLGFEVRDVLACMQGPPIGAEIPAIGSVRPPRPIWRHAIASVGASTATIAPARCAIRSIREVPSSSSTEAGSADTRLRLPSSVTPSVRRHRTSRR